MYIKFPCIANSTYMLQHAQLFFVARPVSVQLTKAATSIANPQTIAAIVLWLRTTLKAFSYLILCIADSLIGVDTTSALRVMPVIIAAVIANSTIWTRQSRRVLAGAVSTIMCYCQYNCLSKHNIYCTKHRPLIDKTPGWAKKHSLCLMIVCVQSMFEKVSKLSLRGGYN